MSATIKLVKGREFFIVEEGTEADLHLRSKGFTPAGAPVAAAADAPAAADETETDDVEDTIEQLAAAAPAPRKRR